MTKQQSGFTLLEVLLAVAITALIGVGATQLLSTTASTKATTEKRGQQLRDIQRMDLWVKRDISELSGRSVLNIYGTAVDPLTTDSDYLVEFTRSGQPALITNDDEDAVSARSNMQRVGYAVRSHEHEFCKDVQSTESTNDSDYNKQCLVRLFWSALDQASDSEPKVQLLLDEVEEFRFFYRGQLVDFTDPSNTITIEDWQEDWPGPYITPNLTADLVQIKLVLTTKELGEITRLYEVPRFAFTKS